jgi:hypothetical protein
MGRPLVALIEYVCDAKHVGEYVNRDGPTITLVDGAWAHCERGGSERHSWEHIQPTALGALHVGAQDHAAHLTH